MVLHSGYRQPEQIGQICIGNSARSQDRQLPFTWRQALGRSRRNPQDTAAPSVADSMTQFGAGGGAVPFRTARTTPQSDSTVACIPTTLTKPSRPYSATESRDRSLAPWPIVLDTAAIRFRSVVRIRRVSTTTRHGFKASSFTNGTRRPICIGTVKTPTRADRTTPSASAFERDTDRTATGPTPTSAGASGSDNVATIARCIRGLGVNPAACAPEEFVRRRKVCCIEGGGKRTILAAR